MAVDTAAAVIATLIPNVGFLMAKWMAQKLSRNIWMQDLNLPPWATDNVRNALTPAWAVANFMMGHLSYVVWNNAKRWKGIKLPMASYAFLLLLFWAQYPIYLATRSLKYGLVDILLAMVVAIATFVLFRQTTSLTIPLMSLFMVLLAHECYYSFWLLKHNPPEREPPRLVNHTEKGKSSCEPTATAPMTKGTKRII